jgi:nitroreductase
MEFVDVVRARRMVRAYDGERPVDPQVISAILDLATRAPSAGFSQGWHFLVLNDEESRDAFWTATAGARPADAWLDGMRTAPVLIIPMSDRSAYLQRYARPDKSASTSATPTTPASGNDDRQWPVPYWDIDTGMATVIALLAAVDHGLAGCFFGIPAERGDAVRQELLIPSHLNPIGVIAIGYQAHYSVAKPRRRRRPAADVVSWGRFGGQSPAVATQDLVEPA